MLLYIRYLHLVLQPICAVFAQVACHSGARNDLNAARSSDATRDRKFFRCRVQEYEDILIPRYCDSLMRRRYSTSKMVHISAGGLVDER